MEYQSTSYRLYVSRPRFIHSGLPAGPAGGPLAEPRHPEPDPHGTPYHETRLGQLVHHIVDQHVLYDDGPDPNSPACRSDLNFLLELKKMTERRNM